MGELKPCPFCGGEANSEIDDYGLCTEHFVECLSCVARTSTYDSPKEAVAAWNDRAETEAEKKIKEIREKLNLLKKDARLLDNECECVAIDYVTDCLIDILEGEK